jgi:hypothetical protein
MEVIMTEKETKSKSPHMDEAREHMKAAREAIHGAWEAWVPAGYLEKRRAFRKEMLKAMRSMLDAAIERSERP